MSITESHLSRPQYFEYTQAANVKMPAILPHYMDSQENGIVPIDLSVMLETSYPATSPACLASFINLSTGQNINCQANATSNLLIVISGSVTVSSKQSGCCQMGQWDIITIPYTENIMIYAAEPAKLYWVNDAPLMSYLGATPTTRIFSSSIYRRAEIEELVKQFNSDFNAKKRNRNGILLSNEDCPLTKTVTPTLWSLFNITAKQSIQLPHQHNSVALDLCLYAPDKSKGRVYTIMSKTLDDNGQHVNPVIMQWESGKAFITPPGWWHSHVNETDEDAIVFPVQDAGIHTYFRTLFIKFYA
ncbi:cupin domain-containing protein [Cysteiniphilum halobium]|uniref:cupin n=1 Tax=Cysteiniphilum halobium TaxID=2219059 RepID=UPI001F38DBF3|nr:cupin [Cysteiniphilum halobium]